MMIDTSLIRCHADIQDPPTITSIKPALCKQSGRCDVIGGRGCDCNDAAEAIAIKYNKQNHKAF